MQGDPRLFRGELPQVWDVAHILAGFFWCVRELLMCKSQPILVGTAHGGATANYRIVRWGWVDCGFKSHQRTLMFSCFDSPKQRSVICGKYRLLGICSTRAATKVVSCCGHTKQDHRSPGGHSHGREQSSSPRSTAHLEQLSSLFLLGII